MAVRHKCFISYHQDDEGEVTNFVIDFRDVFIPKILGVSDVDDFIDSDEADYVLRRIRELYLTDSTVTIVMVGKCTWARKYVDWEVASTLRNDPNNKRSGLMAVALPSVSNDSTCRLPDRVNDNVLGSDGDEGYARWWKYPETQAGLRNMIETALNFRDTREPDNSRKLRERNSSC